jgi:hypothetical protein
MKVSKKLKVYSSLYKGAETNKTGTEKDKFRAETEEFILKKKKWFLPVFTLGAEIEQKFGFVNGCRNWWTPVFPFFPLWLHFPVRAGIQRIWDSKGKTRRKWGNYNFCFILKTYW